MARSKSKRNKPAFATRRKRPVARVREWVGGQITMPIYVAEPAPFRPEMFIWLEMPEAYIVGSQIVDPAGPRVTIADALEGAMNQPMIGRPRRPTHIRIASEDNLEDLRRLVPDADVVVMPTPEVDAFLREMTDGLDGGEEPSYTEGGTIPLDVIESLFETTAALYEVAPWSSVDDYQVLRLDLPTLGVDGVCVSILGALGESFGFVLFPSYQHYDAFVAASERMTDNDFSLDLGTSMLALNFDRAGELPRSLREEAMEHRWPVAGANAYPWLSHTDPDLTARPISEHDVRVVTACARALAAFVPRHRDLFEEDRSFTPVSESYFDVDGVEARLTVPYLEDDLFGFND